MATSVPTLTLNNGRQMPMLGLGTFNKFKKGEVVNAVRTAVQCGYRLIDTAWVYQCEDEVGDAIKDVVSSGIVKREDLFIVSKLWNTFHEPSRVEAGIRESLTDLKLDYVDLYLMHWPMAFKEPEEKRAWIMNTDIQPNTIDFIETWRAMEMLVDKGLTRAIGVSNFNISQMKRLLSASNLRYKPANLQIEINPYLSNNDIVTFCQEHNITVTAFTPLAKGGQEYAGKPAPNLMEEKILQDIARKHNKTPAQVVFRWGIQRGYSIVPKSVTPQRIRENIQIFDFQLTDEDMSLVSSLNCNRRLVTLENFKAFPEYPFEVGS